MTFSAATQAWFDGVFDAPTPAQTAAWQAIGSGQHALVIAPTGSGKTLAAFLHSLDRLAAQPPSSKVRVLYISPLKALAVDVERNLRAPLRGIQLSAERLGLPAPQVRVAVRSGDTPAADRRRLLSNPPDILITTPESLFLMLSSQMAETLDEVETIILDEVHALAGTKRGVHLALSLERLTALRTSPGEAQRIGLSATVEPPERVAAFLGGDRPVTVVNPPAAKTWQLDVEVPLADMTDLSSPPGQDAADPDAPPSNSIWPFLEDRILELVDQHRSTICFVNSRRVAERLTAHLNDLHARRLEPDGANPPPSLPPAQVMAQSGASAGNDGSHSPVIARAHHGSVSKERRAQIEADLKSGNLPCVVATSSLELGIDMGAVDLVIQVASPPSVASGLQRIGRAGHQVGAVSQGVLLPTHRGDLVESAVLVSRMRAGQIEQVHQLRNPLDVLAQQLVSLCVDHTWPVEDVWQLVRRCDGFRELPRSAFEAVLDMLSGRYPSEDFAELRPRLVWDRTAGTLSGRPGARRLVSTSGGTIPDRGLFGVFLVGEGTASGKHEAGRRVGELDEEMVYESRVGDVFTLGTTAWRIQEITPNQVLVSPAPGQPGRLPFWRGDSPGRPAELGRAIGEFTRRLAREADADQVLVPTGLDDSARRNLGAYLAEQREATGVLPDDRTIVVERFRDELGDWRLCLHSNLGSAVLQPWALVVEARARERYGVEAQATASNDGIVLRIPDVESTPPGLDLVQVDPDEVEQLVTEQVFGSALFAARFRECSARALLLPRRDPGRRSPLWQQRMRSAQLLAVASQYPDFPMVLETMRECLEDVFDLPALTEVLRQVASRRIRLVEVETPEASPFAKSLLFGYIGEFIYDGDQPLAERKLAALSLDPALLAELLGREGGRQVLDEQVMAELEAELQHLPEDRRARGPEQLWDLLRTIGPLTPQECRERCTEDPTDWLAELTEAGRVAACRLGGRDHLAVADDFALLRDALGIPVPARIAAPTASTDPAEALGRLVTRWGQCHVVFTAAQLATRYGVSEALVEQALARMVREQDVVAGNFGWPGLTGQQYIRQRVLTLVKRRTLAALRAGVEAVDQCQFARHLVRWQECDAPQAGSDALLAAVEGLAGYPIPASMLESVVLPARVAGYRPELLDQALAAGEVVWTGRGAIGRNDGWLQLWPADCVLTDADDPGSDSSSPPLGELAQQLFGRLAAGGAWTLADLTPDGIGSGAAEDALWELVWAGMVHSSSLAPVRQLSGRGALKHRAPARPSRRAALRAVRVAVPQGMPGRWAAVRTTHPDPSARRLAELGLELGRYGVLTRGSVLTEAMGGNFSEAYRVLLALEETGVARRGYFIDGLGAAQFALPGAVDRLREPVAETAPLVLAACDPANPFGAALPWPPSDGHRPSRKAGALVVLDDGLPTLYLERGVHTLLTFGADQARLQRALSAVAQTVQAARLGTITIEKANSQPVLPQKELGGLLTGAGFTMTPQGFRLRPGTGHHH
ncbi:MULTISPECIES: ATP-dependent helicase [unclassified Luteococcus]|uniref:ATP-dependent helicase n=1 Tax=unclassified Luteococcus TaxID=2639923 RepID=UPI00313ACADB